MPVTQYIGSRYVPVFANPIEWSSVKEYEPLTIVLHEGNSYTSKQAVPKGIDITNEAFWALTGNYNAQVELYRRETATAQAAADAAQNDIETLLPKSDFSAENTVKQYIDQNKTRIIAFDTVADMQEATNLVSGMTCHTNGFHTPGDDGAAYYTISANGTANGMDVLVLHDGLFATLIVTEPYVNPKMFGAKGNANYHSNGSWFENPGLTTPAHDDTSILQYVLNNYTDIYFSKGNYLYTALLMPVKCNIKGTRSDVTLIGGQIKIVGKGNFLEDATKYFTTGSIDNITFYGGFLLFGDSVDDIGHNFLVQDVCFTSGGNATAITLKNHCAFMKFVNLEISRYNIAFYLDFSDAIDSGAQIVFQNCATGLSNCSYKQSGVCEDGADIFFDNCDFEHTAYVFYFDDAGGNFNVTNMHNETIEQFCYMQSKSGSKITMNYNGGWIFQTTSTNNKPLFELMENCTLRIETTRIQFIRTSGIIKTNGKNSLLQIDGRTCIMNLGFDGSSFIGDGYPTVSFVNYKDVKNDYALSSSEVTLESGTRNRVQRRKGKAYITIPASDTTKESFTLAFIYRNTDTNNDIAYQRIIPIQTASGERLRTVELTPRIFNGKFDVDIKEYYSDPASQYGWTDQLFSVANEYHIHFNFDAESGNVRIALRNCANGWILNSMMEEF